MGSVYSGKKESDGIYLYYITRHKACQEQGKTMLLLQISNKASGQKH